MKVRRLKSKFLLAAVTICIIMSLSSMLAVSWVIHQQFLNQSHAQLIKASSLINDNLAERKDSLLAASRQLAMQKNLGSTIWYLAQYARTDANHQILFNTYLQLAKDAEKIGRTAKLSKIAIYDATGNLIAFTSFDSSSELVGFVESFPTPAFQVTTLKDGEELSSKNLQRANSVAKIDFEFGGRLPQDESVHYAVVDELLAIESYIPIMGSVYDPMSGKQEIKQLGFVVAAQSLDQAFAEHLSHLTDTKINVFIPQGFNSGVVSAYQKPDWGSVQLNRSPQPIAITFNETTINGQDHYQSLIPLYNDKLHVGTIAALRSQDVVVKNTWEIILILGLIEGVSLLLIFPFAWYFASSISRPLSLLSHVFHDISSGKQSGTLSDRFRQLEIEKKRDDELGDFTQSFINMDHAVNQKIREINEINASLEHKVEERTTTLGRMTLLYAALGHCNEAIVRCNNEEELFPQICHDTVEFGGIKMAWIGLLDQQSKEIRRFASYGSGTEYLEEIQLSSDENNASGRGPVGISIREDRPVWCQDFMHDNTTAAWKELGAKFGWGALAALPLHRNGVVIGVFALYSSEANAFDQDARGLLGRMVMDIDYALNNFEHQAQHRDAEAALRLSEDRFRTIFNDAPIGIALIDSLTGHIYTVNPMFAKIAGRTLEEIANIDWMSITHPDDVQEDLDNMALMNAGKIPGFQMQKRYLHPDGTPVWINMTATPIFVEDKAHPRHLCMIEDITKRKADDEQIQQLAFYDSLTQLPNRRLLLERLKHGINIEQRDGKLLALLMIDLDRFKGVNDSHGHLAGDELLQHVAGRITRRLRDVDMAARWGGDEFIVLLEHIAQPEDAARVAEEIIAELSKPFCLKENDNVQIGASIGISLYPLHGSSPEALMDYADAALYQAKDAGRGCFSFFSEDLTIASRERMLLETRLRRAIEKQELNVFFQAQVNINNERIIGAEALVRWQDPIEGLILPLRFIPIAEESGLIVEIGAWVLRETCRQGKQWLDEGFPPITLAVNVSPHQFRRGNICTLVALVLEETGFPACQLELEITEGTLMGDQKSATMTLEALRALGVRLAIDDFGTGYSSLSYLKHFPLDILKIDKSFIDDIPFHKDDMEIAATIIAMGHILGFKVLAEGVETPEQLAFLLEKGCDSYQGYIKSKPVSAHDFAELLHKQLRDEV